MDISLLLTLVVFTSGVRRIFDWRGPAWRPVKGNSLSNILMTFLVIVVLDVLPSWSLNVLTRQ